MAKIYLVDSENIGASWSQLLPTMSQEDKMFVFYTEKSPYISYDNLLQVIAHCQIPVFIKCYEGKNALDFQLVSELGFKMSQEPKAEFIIVSDDYGYDAAVRYWKERRYNVHRIGKKNCKPMPPRKAEEVAVRAASEEAVKVPETELLIMEEQEALQEAYLKQAKVEETVAEQPEAEQSEAEVSEVQPEEVVVEDTQTSDVLEQMEAEPVQPKTEQEQPKVQDEAENLQPKEQAASEAQEDAPAKSQDSLKENQPQKRVRERKKKYKKEPAKEPEIAVEQSEQEAQEGAKQLEKEVVTETEEVCEDPLDVLLLEIVNKCKSQDPMKDAFTIKEMFHSISMSSLTDVNTALKILIGNELGNDIYRELKEYQECRTLLDVLYLPDAKRRFMKYVQTVLERSELEGITAKTIGDFLLSIPRKNLNSIRSAMIKEYGHEQGSLIYTVFKPHIKVLNNI